MPGKKTGGGDAGDNKPGDGPPSRHPPPSSGPPGSSHLAGGSPSKNRVNHDTEADRKVVDLETVE